MTMTVNASWGRGLARTATYLVEKWRLLGTPPGADEMTSDVRVDPLREGNRAFPAGCQADARRLRTNDGEEEQIRWYRRGT